MFTCRGRLARQMPGWAFNAPQAHLFPREVAEKA